MDHRGIFKQEVNHFDIKIEDHLIKSEPGLYQEPEVSNNSQLRQLNLSWILQVKPTQKMTLPNNSNAITVPRDLFPDIN